MKQSKVVLLRPPDPMGMVDVLSHVLPTNLCYIGGSLKQGGIGFEIWDYEQESFAAGDFPGILEAASPQIVGISCMTPTIINGHNVASLVKNISRISLLLSADLIPRRCQKRLCESFRIPTWL